MGSHLEGKTIAVSGAGPGLGKEVAACALRDGANVVLGARTAEKLEATAAEAREAARLLHDHGWDDEARHACIIAARCVLNLDDRTTARRLLEEAGVAITPGIDFGTNRPETHVRFAYTTSMENLREGVQRLRKFLA